MMKEILYKKRQSLKYHRKTVSIRENSENKECRTCVRKSFVYIVSPGNEIEAKSHPPEIDIKKSLDTKKNEEKFSFRVKGEFSITQGRRQFKIDFCHTLKIDIVWKNKIFSPKKSANLT